MHHRKQKKQKTDHFGPDLTLCRLSAAAAEEAHLFPWLVDFRVPHRDRDTKLLVVNQTVLRTACLIALPIRSRDHLIGSAQHSSRGAVELRGGAVIL